MQPSVLTGSCSNVNGHGFVGVALEADGILGRCCAQLFRQKSAVLVVTVATPDQPLIDAVAEGTLKVLLGFGVAGVAESGLLFDQQVLRLLGMVRRVAGDATHFVRVVLGAGEVRVFLAIFVACETAAAGLGRISAREGEDLALVASGFHVRPGPWHASQPRAFSPWRPNVVFQCGVASNFLNISSWQVLQVSLPAYCAASTAAAGAGVLLADPDFDAHTGRLRNAADASAIPALNLMDRFDVFMICALSCIVPSRTNSARFH
jgi:hypothetical protein